MPGSPMLAVGLSAAIPAAASAAGASSGVATVAGRHQPAGGSPLASSLSLMGRYLPPVATTVWSRKSSVRKKAAGTGFLGFWLVAKPASRVALHNLFCSNRWTRPPAGKKLMLGTWGHGAEAPPVSGSWVPLSVIGYERGGELLLTCACAKWQAQGAHTSGRVSRPVWGRCCAGGWVGVRFSVGYTRFGDDNGRFRQFMVALLHLLLAGVTRKRDTLRDAAFRAL